MPAFDASPTIGSPRVEEKAMGRNSKLWSTVVVVLLGALLTPASGAPAQAKVPGTNGRIGFARQDLSICGDCTTSFTVNPDGSHQQSLLPASAGESGGVHWSPDGTHAVTGAETCPSGESCAAIIVDPDTGSFRELPAPVFSNEFHGCFVWSPDGSRLACDFVSDTPGLTGIYTIRSSDGGGLTRVLACSDECGPTDYSPDGTRLVIVRADASGQPELFVIRVNGTGLRQITPSGTLVDVADGYISWSPSGNHILFGGRVDPDHRRAIFVVNSDGTELHRIPVPGCGGALADPRSVTCFDPSWSPDGTKFVFARGSAMVHVQNIYTAKADGSGLFQVTHIGSGLGAWGPDWGPHPVS
jgi:Tol biopolymer transport system component